VIWAYPNEVTVSRRLTLHVSTTATAFRVDAYRQGAQLEFVGCLGTDLPGLSLPFGGPTAAWAWPSYAFEIDPHWKPGVYIAVLTPLGSAGHPLDAVEPGNLAATSGKALFIVEGAETAPILYKLPTFTYHAYNGTGYGSLYAEAVWSRREPRGFRATMHRPGGGVGGLVMPGDSPDYYRPQSRRQSFAHWDAPFIAWLERSGYHVAYCSDLDVHRDPGRLEKHPLLLSVGHDEYWTDEIREAIGRFLDKGGNVAFLSGNISGWRVQLTDDDRTLVCIKMPPGPEDFARSESWQWDRWQSFRPEDHVTGVSFFHAGGLWDGERPPVGYTTELAEHWSFSGTALTRGEKFGTDPDLPLVGYEADGAPFLRRHGLPIPSGDATPESFAILATAALGEEWSSRGRPTAATAGTYTTPNGGIVFQAATTDWPLVAAQDAVVERITRNVLDRLSHRSVPILGPLPLIAGTPRAVAGAKATFAAGIGQLSPRDWRDVSYRWHIGQDVVEAGSPTIVIDVPAEPRVLSVAVEVIADHEVIAFGASTTLSLTREEATRVQIVQLLREIASPGDPSGILVQPTRDALEAALEINRINMPWMQERATQLRQLLESLLSDTIDIESESGRRYLAEIRRVVAAAAGKGDGSTIGSDGNSETR
jgi:hypothetical protein